MSGNLRTVTLTEREYRDFLSFYRAYINDSIMGDLQIEYVAKEDKENFQGAQHQKAQEKGFNLGILLDGELVGIDVKRGSDWTPFLRK